MNTNKHELQKPEGIRIDADTLEVVLEVVQAPERITVRWNTVYMMSDFIDMIGGYLSDICDAVSASIVDGDNVEEIRADLQKIKEFTLRYGDITFKNCEDKPGYCYLTPAKPKRGKIH